MGANAYLIVICLELDNSILSVDVWSQPEWKASRRLPDVVTYVAYQITAGTFSEAMGILLIHIKEPGSRYNYLVPYLREGLK